MKQSLRAALTRGAVALGAVALLIPSRIARGQGAPLDEDNRREVTLKDNTKVVLFGDAPGLGSSAKSTRFHYLPVNLRLATDNGKPQFLFLKYTTEAEPTNGGIQGGLLHFLMEWGLSAEQQQELQQKLAEQVPGAQVVGAADVSVAGDNGSFKIISATLSSSARTRTLVMSGKAPVLPGSKVAVAADLDQYGAQLLDATFAKARTITDVSIELALTYPTQIPALEGWVHANWTKLAHSYDSLQADYKRTHTSDAHSESCFLWVLCASSTVPQYSYSYEELQRQYNYLIEKQIIQFDVAERADDPRLAKVREAFLQFFLDRLAKPVETAAAPAPADTTKTPDIKQGDAYTYRRVRSKDSQEIKDETFNLKYRLTFNRPITLTGNLATWYDGVRDNPNAVAFVNLNDPRFQHYDVRFRVDFDAPTALFSSAINYVNVAVRKERDQGNPFEKSVQIDENYIKDHGVLATFTYGRGEDANPADYEYSVQWSLRGGKRWPLTPMWQHGNALESVALVPPVTPHKIELEGDLAGLKASDITRVTAQVHYMQFGQEVEENIQLSAAGGEPIVAKTLFMDRDAKGYAYRLVVNHKTEGKLALPWSPKVGDDYIYAVVPAELLAVGSLKDAAKAAAQTVAVSAAEKVLDRFQSVLGGNKP